MVQLQSSTNFRQHNDQTSCWKALWRLDSMFFRKAIAHRFASLRDKPLCSSLLYAKSKEHSPKLSRARPHPLHMAITGRNITIINNIAEKSKARRCVLCMARPPLSRDERTKAHNISCWRGVRYGTILDDQQRQTPRTEPESHRDRMEIQRQRRRYGCEPFE